MLINTRLSNYTGVEKALYDLVINEKGTQIIGKSTPFSTVICVSKDSFSRSKTCLSIYESLRFIKILLIVDKKVLYE